MQKFWHFVIVITLLYYIFCKNCIIRSIVNCVITKILCTLVTCTISCWIMPRSDLASRSYETLQKSRLSMENVNFICSQHSVMRTYILAKETCPLFNRWIMLFYVLLYVSKYVHKYGFLLYFIIYHFTLWQAHNFFISLPYVHAFLCRIMSILIALQDF